jgi:hypothetical protein
MGQVLVMLSLRKALQAAEYPAAGRLGRPGVVVGATTVVGNDRVGEISADVLMTNNVKSGTWSTNVKLHDLLLMLFTGALQRNKGRMESIR